jgi:hypothetical protein
MSEHNVDYTFYDRPKFLSPKAERGINLDIDETVTETIKPSSAFLNKIANKFSPRKNTSIFEKITNRRSKIRTNRRSKIRTNRRSKTRTNRRSKTRSKKSKSKKRKRSLKKIKILINE